MNQSSIPTTVRWRKNDYSVRIAVVDDVVTVITEPECEELLQAVQSCVEGDSHKHLAIYLGFGFNYLVCDSRRGE